MKFTFNKMIGETMITFEDTADNDAQFFQKAAFYFELPEVCANCDGKSLKVTHRMPKGYDFYAVACDNCDHELPYGQLKDTKGKLFAKDWTPPYKREQGGPV